MTRLEILLNSLATVLVRYHDYQKGVDKIIPDSDAKKSREYAAKLFQTENDGYKTELESIILKATKSYKKRTNLLYFILNAIIYFSEIKQKKQTLDAHDFNQFKTHIVTLIKSLQSLLTTYQNQQCSVGPIPISLTNSVLSQDTMLMLGLKNDGLILGSTYCYSGGLIEEEIFKPLGILASASLEEIDNIIEGLCQHQQMVLSISALQSQLQEKDKTISELQKANSEKDILIIELRKQLELKQNPTAISKDNPPTSTNNNFRLFKNSDGTIVTKDPGLSMLNWTAK